MSLPARALVRPPHGVVDDLQRVGRVPAVNGDQRLRGHGHAVHQRIGGSGSQGLLGCDRRAVEIRDGQPGVGRPGPRSRPLGIGEYRGSGGSFQNRERVAVLALRHQGIGETEPGGSLAASAWARSSSAPHICLAAATGRPT